MSRKVNKLGGKVRALRRQRQLTQVQLAQQLEISASYLNLIEHNRRPLTAPLLIKLAQLFQLDLQTLSEDRDSQLLASLLEIFGDPLFESFELSNADVQELSNACPQVARAVLALYQAYQNLRETSDTLASHLSDGDELTGLSRVQLPSEEVSDVLQRHMNYFPDLEEASETVWSEGRMDPQDPYHGLVRALEQDHEIQVTIRSPGALQGAVRQYDAKSRQMILSEALRPEGRNFQLAHMLGLLSQTQVLDRIVRDQVLSSPESRALCRVALANYFAAAVLMPYDRFLQTAQAERYDIELLCHRFSASFEQVCHRLTTLHKPGSRGVPMHLVRIDIAGNISKRFSASGIRFARYSASCPLWNVHAAFHTPGRIRVQLSEMPSGQTYLSVARTLERRSGGYHAPHSLQALSIGCEVKHAQELVYSDGLDLEHPDATVPVGVTCRLCERMDCAQRAMPPLHHPLRVDEHVRGLSFYAPVRKSDG